MGHRLDLNNGRQLFELSGVQRSGEYYTLTFRMGFLWEEVGIAVSLAVSLL